MSSLLYLYVIGCILSGNLTEPTTSVISDSPSTRTTTTNNYYSIATNTILTIDSISGTGMTYTEPIGSGIMTSMDYSSSGMTEHAASISENTLFSHFSSSTPRIIKTTVTISNTFQSSITPATTPNYDNPGMSAILVISHNAHSQH